MGTSAIFASGRAGAQPEGALPPTTLPVAFGADELRLDTQTQALEATGHVRVDEPPFHLTSDALTLRRVPIGAQLDGNGRVAFCPCLGSPLAVRFTGATVAPPHDLILRNPVLEVFGIPLAWAPVFWLRSTGRIGLLPPDLAWRGADGFFAGAGVHLPWRQGDLVRGFDLRAGAYFRGGAAVDGVLRTTTTETRVRWDDLLGDHGVTIEARGATAIANADRADSVAWTIDALRGTRAVQATTDLDAAAKPFDRATAEAAWRVDGWSIGSQVRAVALRGSDVLEAGVAGPVLSIRRADALAGAGAYDATIEGGELAGGGYGATSFARAEAGALLATRAGPAGLSLDLRGLGDVADDGVRDGVDGFAEARAGLRVPFVRPFESSDLGDPWVHRTEPRLEAAAFAAHTDGVLVVPIGRGAPDALGDHAAWIGAAGWRNTVGRSGSRAAADIDLAAGAIGDSAGVRPLLRARAAIDGPWVGLLADFARIVPLSGLVGSSNSTFHAEPGGAFIATGRLGPTTGLHLTVHAAERDGVDPYEARALTEVPYEAASGFLSATGWTGGARAGLPIGSRVTARGGADVDFSAANQGGGGQPAQLVAAAGALEVHDPCNCVVVRASAAHRVGREGVDIWLSVDLNASP